MRTTYHDSDGWPRPLRAPQHAAAPFGPSAPTRLQVQRALRLVATAGLWAAGLCLVIGAIVLVVAQARPDRLAPLSATTPSRISSIEANAASPVAGLPGRTKPVRRNGAAAGRASARRIRRARRPDDGNLPHRGQHQLADPVVLHLRGRRPGRPVRGRGRRAARGGRQHHRVRRGRPRRHVPAARQPGPPPDRDLQLFLDHESDTAAMTTVTSAAELAGLILLALAIALGLRRRPARRRPGAAAHHQP